MLMNASVLNDCFLHFQAAPLPVMVTVMTMACQIRMIMMIASSMMMMEPTAVLRLVVTTVMRTGSILVVEEGRRAKKTFRS